MSELNSKLAYVVGDAYYELSRLPGVLTATQFFKSVIDGSLPLDRTWMTGQGLSSVEESLLRLCKNYRSEIRFYSSDLFESNDDTQSDISTEQPHSLTVFSKLSRMMTTILQAGKKSIHRLSAFNQ